MPTAPFGEPPQFSPEPAESAPVVQCHQVIHETQLAITRYLQDLQAGASRPLGTEERNEERAGIAEKLDDISHRVEPQAWAEYRAQQGKGIDGKTAGQLAQLGPDPELTTFRLQREAAELVRRRAMFGSNEQHAQIERGELEALLMRNEPAYGVAMMRLSTLDSVVPYYQEVNRTVQDLEQELARRRRVLSGEDLSLQDPEGRVNNAVRQIDKIDDAIPTFTTQLHDLDAPQVGEADIVLAAEREGKKAALSDTIRSLRESREKFIQEYRQRAAEVMVGPASVEATEEELRAARGKLPQPLTEEEGANTHVGGLANETIRNVYATLDAANTTTEVVGLQVVDQIVALRQQLDRISADAPRQVIIDKIRALVGTVADTDVDRIQALVQAKLQAQVAHT